MLLAFSIFVCLPAFESYAHKASGFLLIFLFRECQPNKQTNQASSQWVKAKMKMNIEENSKQTKRTPNNNNRRRRKKKNAQKNKTKNVNKCEMKAAAEKKGRKRNRKAPKWYRIPLLFIFYARILSRPSWHQNNLNAAALYLKIIVNPVHNQNWFNRGTKAKYNTIAKEYGGKCIQSRTHLI